MASFLEWYVLERPSAGAGRARRRSRTPSRPAAKAPAAERRTLAHLASSHRSLFQLAAAADRVLEIDDLIGGARFSVLERRNTAGVAPGDVFEARLIWDAAERGGRARARDFRPHVPVSPARRARRGRRVGRAGRRSRGRGARRSCSTSRATTSAGTASATSARPRSTAMAADPGTPRRVRSAERFAAWRSPCCSAPGRRRERLPARRRPRAPPADLRHDRRRARTRWCSGATSRTTGLPRASWRERLETGRQLYRAGLARRIIVSGAVRPIQEPDGFATTSPTPWPPGSKGAALPPPTW